MAKKTELAKKIEAIRKAMGMERREFAQIFKVSDSTISRWENATAKPEGGSLMILEVMERAMEKAKKKLTAKRLRDAIFAGGAGFALYLFFKELYKDRD